MSGDYEVGYKRPPKHTRFRKGCSGNPQGRPKGTKNLTTDLDEELQERVLVKEGGTQRQISKQRAMVKSLIANAIKGDTRATTIVYTMMLRLLDLSDENEADQPLNEDERAVFQTLEDQILRRAEQRKALQQTSHTAERKLELDDV